jgi:hypothetical protein
MGASAVPDVATRRVGLCGVAPAALLLLLALAPAPLVADSGSGSRCKRGPAAASRRHVPLFVRLRRVTCCLSPVRPGDRSGKEGGPIAGLPLQDVVRMWEEPLFPNFTDCPDVRPKYPEVYGHCIDSSSDCW